MTPLQELDRRSREIFRTIVEAYLETGEPVGSRTISRRGVDLSPASIRNVMSDLAALGLLDAPHISAGRQPSHMGLRFFVDSLLQTGEVSDMERAEIDSRLTNAGRDIENVLNEASEVLSGLTGGASLVASPTQDAPIKQVDFIPIAASRALCILVSDSGEVENRIIDFGDGIGPSTLMEATNYLNARMRGRRLSEARAEIETELSDKRAQLDAAAANLIRLGVVEWSGEEPDRGRSLIVRGRANLLESAGAKEDLERIGRLFDELERKKSMLSVLDSTRDAAGARIFIGSENPLFSLSGSSLIVSSYMNSDRKIVGALGVIGPTSLNYARVIPMVDYTAKVVGQILDGRQQRD
ncbi:MAG: heat-inducible transcriptional repressor HrcA [Ponticaulis sp.]|nr:heat-inducible transcriptional repressor HrcA [Ponticaulis sp.]|tara:strand:- start:63997 stop:65058 length:1062 start_codon:yes stop_codon:yes gene_type:complete